MAGQTSEPNTLYFDRLLACHRETKGGTLQLVGGEEGGVKLRILQSSTTKTLRTITLHSSITLAANAVFLKVLSISANGYEIRIMLNEFQVRNFKRVYVFRFFDLEATKRFFTNIGLGSDHPSFEEMMEAAEEKEEKKLRERIVSSLSSLDLEDLKDEDDEDDNDNDNEEESFEFEASQDVYALNCAAVLPKKW